MLSKSDSELGRVYNFRILGALENEITKIHLVIIILHYSSK